MKAIDDLSLTAGAMVTPRIRLLEPLGRGAMGSVWLAEHLGLECRVVVKFMSRDYLDDQGLRARFDREASLAARAKGPHVVQVFDHGITEHGIPFIAMEHLEGEDLGKLLKREGRIDPKRYAYWFLQIARGVNKAHKNGVVHRDLKPENIFLCENDGEVLVKILDFGIAKGESNAGFSATATNALIGTPYYMSPEQMMGAKNIDSRVDIWALGVVTYRAIVGELPFDASVIGQLVQRIGVEPHVPPSSIVSELGPEIDEWMDRALAKSADDRFQSAKEMAEAFAILVGVPVPSASADLSNDASQRISRASIPSAPGLGSSTISATTSESSAGGSRALPRVVALVAGVVVVCIGVAAALFIPPRTPEIAPASTAPIKPATAESSSDPVSSASQNARAVPPPPPPPTAPLTTAPLAPPQVDTPAQDAGATQAPAPNAQVAPTGATGTPAAAGSAGTSRRRPRPVDGKPSAPNAANPLDMSLQ